MCRDEGIDIKPRIHNDQRKVQIRTLFEPSGLRLARLMLLSQGCGVPLKKKDLIEQAKLTARSFNHDLEEANRYLGNYMSLRIVELGIVPLDDNKQSPKRNEYAIISLSTQQRSVFYKAISQLELWGWNVTCLILILLVLKGEGATGDYLESALKRSGLNNAGSPNIEFKTQLAKLCARRILEHNERSNTYFVGPLASQLISKEELLKLIIKLYFSREQFEDPGFEKKYDVSLRTLKQQIEDRFV